MAHTNSLINETSPYLLQHAHNPVNWYPWSDTALEKARVENKPILVSIGYAACHWCHVMERESFENEETAALMNEHFINIKIDREERPDLDHIYMDAVQAMTGSGGWPLNVFLTPAGKPFYGGTYFPPQRAFNRPSWKEILVSVSNAFKEKRHEIDAQAENLTDHLLQSNSFGQQEGEAGFEIEKTDEICRNLLKTADKTWGGFGNAPKFPHSFSIQYLFRYFFHFREPGKEANEALQQALLSLDKMIDGGIYDQLGGGFARYSTDVEWLAPHFEKMLYDNALLLIVLSEAYMLTGKRKYREVIDETIAFARRELMNSEYGFFSALDADSEGVEGKFYVWDKEEIKKYLGSDADLFCEFFDVSEAGNWEHTNILRIKTSLEDFAKNKGLNEDHLRQVLKDSKKKLFEIRNKRQRPLLDDKVILGWNALMNIACSSAFEATGEELYREMAEQNMEFLLARFIKGDRFHHTWKNDVAKYPAFLDDMAFLIAALMRLQGITGKILYLQAAGDNAKRVIDDFSDENGMLFYYTPSFQQDVIVRKKEVYDGALPSGNAVMAQNLWRLGILLDMKEWKERAGKMVSSFSNAITRYPHSFGVWACLYQEMATGTMEIAITGKDHGRLHLQVLGEYIPQKVLMSSSSPVEGFPLLAGKETSSEPCVYVCSGYSCQPPVFSANDLMLLINRLKNR